MRQGEVEAFAGNRRVQHLQIVVHTQGFGQRQPRIAFVEHVVGTPEQKLLERLGQAGHTLEGQVLLGEGIELLAKAVADQRVAGQALEIHPAAIGEGLALAHPDHAGGEEERRVHIIHMLQARQRDEGPRDQVDATGAHLVLGSRPGAGVDNVDHHTEFLG